MIVKDIQFDSEGTPCAGTFYLPEGKGPFPGVLLSHGFGAVRGMRNIPEVGSALAAAGIAALAIDFRYLGDSGGLPRQQVLPWAQRQDMRNGISHLQSLDIVDGARIGLWGTSFSGGQSIQVAAFDRRVKALVVQVPATDLYHQIHDAAPAAQRRLLERVIADERFAHFGKAPPSTMKLADAKGKPSVFGVNSFDWATRNEQEHAAFRNEVTIASLEEAVQTDPGHYIEAVSPTPMLVIMAEPDGTVVTSLTREDFGRAGEPKKLVVFEGQHYDVYDKQDVVDMCVSEAVAWFTGHL